MDHLVNLHPQLPPVERRQHERKEALERLLERDGEAVDEVVPLAAVRVVGLFLDDEDDVRGDGAGLLVALRLTDEEMPRWVAEGRGRSRAERRGASATGGGGRSRARAPSPRR